MQSKSNEKNVIRLFPVCMERNATLMCALANRKSTRSFNSKPLEQQDLSDLLWAAKGINRPETGGRTSANALGKYEIDLYVCNPDGACLYCAEEHTLIPLTEKTLFPH